MTPTSGARPRPNSVKRPSAGFVRRLLRERSLRFGRRVSVDSPTPVQHSPSVFDASELIRSPLGIKATAIEIIKAACAVAGAQVGALVLFDMDLLDPSYSSTPLSAGIREFLAEVIPGTKLSRAEAFFYALSPDGKETNQDSSVVDFARFLARSGFSVSVPLVNEDTSFGLIWLASKEWASDSVASVLPQLGPIVSVIIKNAYLFARTVRQQREARALYETSRDISAQLDLDRVLAAIVERAQQLLQADAAHLMILLDQDTGELCVSVPLGIETYEYRHFKMKVSTGLIGKAVFEHRTLYTNDYLHDTGFGHLSDENIQREGIRAMMCAPLFIRDKLLGAIVVCNKGARRFTDEDADLLSSLANSAAVAIENARLYDEERKTVFKLRELNALIDSQYTSLKRSVSIHDELTRVVLDGEGVDGIVRTLSRIVENPVIFEDNVFNLISTAPSIRKDGSGPASESSYQSTLRTLLDRPGIKDQIARAIQQRRPIRMPAFPQYGLYVPRIVAPVVLGSDIVAYVSVPEINRCLEELDFTAIEHGATVLALEMAKRKATVEVERRLRGDLVHDLLAARGVDGETLRQKAAFLGINPSHVHGVMVVRIDKFSDFARDLKGNKNNIVKIKTHLFELVKRNVLKTAPQSIVTDLSNGVVVILDLGTDASVLTEGKVVQLANQIREDVRRRLPNISVCVGLGDPCTRLEELKRSFEEANRAIDILERMGKNDQVICFDKLGAYRIIFRGDDQNEPLRFANDMIGKLIDYDQRHGTFLVDSLEAYLANACHIKNTAEKIYVHLNTLRYRLEKVEEIAGVDLSDAQTRLNLQLAIMIARAFASDTNHSTTTG